MTSFNGASALRPERAAYGLSPDRGRDTSTSGVLRKQPAFQTGEAGEAGNDGEIQGPRPRLAGEHGAIGLDDTQPNIRVRLNETRERRRERTARHGRHEAHGNLTRQPAGIAAHGIVGDLIGAQKLHAAPVIAFAGRGGRDGAAVARE